MRKALLILTIFLSFSFTNPAQAQFKGLNSAPTPTPTPGPKPAPSATPPQEPKPVPCPRVTVQAQTRGMVRDGQPISFVANIAGGDPKVQPTVLWNLSAGAITEGQNTRRITVDTTGAGETFDREIKADIWVGGYAPECVLQASAIVKVIGAARKFGDFGDLPAETVSFHMKTLAEKVGDSTDTIFIIGYAGRKSDRGFVSNRLRIMRNELVTTHKLSPRRVNIIDGGFREEPLFDFWLVPPGAIPPRPQPTVDRREIVYPKATPTPRQI
jgi:hypothetical protein